VFGKLKLPIVNAKKHTTQSESSMSLHSTLVNSVKEADVLEFPLRFCHEVRFRVEWHFEQQQQPHQEDEEDLTSVVTAGCEAEEKEEKW
jgi:hypothetical protein